MKVMDGFWWDSRDPDTRWPGTLHVDSLEGARLKLLIESPFPLIDTVREYECILGTTTSGEDVSLLNAFNRSSTEIFANSVIIGFHAESKDPLISTAAVVLQHLDQWWSQPAIDLDATNSWRDVALRYKAPEPVLLADDAKVRLTLHSSLVGSHERMAHSLKEEIRIELKAVEPMPLSEFQWRVGACQDLLSLACLTVCHIEDLRLVPPEQTHRRFEMGHFHAMPIFRDRDQEPRVWPHFLFSAKDVRDDLPKIFSTWIGIANALLVPRSLYQDAVYGKTFLELRLLHLTQAVEAYHRRSYPGTYMDEADFAERVSAPLQKAIPSGIDSSLKDSLTNRLRFGNEYSFHKRLRTLVKEHKDALTAVTPNPEQWIDIIRDHRNKFTHNPVISGEYHSIDTEQIIRCNYMLRTLLELCFLKSMGMTTEETTALSHKASHYRQVKERFFWETPAV